jgi:hypothetical protein
MGTAVQELNGFEIKLRQYQLEEEIYKTTFDYTILQTEIDRTKGLVQNTGY